MFRLAADPVKVAGLAAPADVVAALLCVPADAGFAAADGAAPAVEGGAEVGADPDDGSAGSAAAAPIVSGNPGCPVHCSFMNLA
jgi:hypothetical protein